LEERLEEFHRKQENGSGGIGDWGGHRLGKRQNQSKLPQNFWGGDTEKENKGTKTHFFQKLSRELRWDKFPK